MRILMINYEYPPIGGGSGNATSHLLEAFSGQPGLQIDLITSGITKEVEWRTLLPSIRIAFLPVKKSDLHYWTPTEIGSWSARAMVFARQLSASQSYDLCHCWSGWPSGVIGHRLRNRQPYIVALRGSDVPGYSKRLRFLDFLIFRRLSRRVWTRAAAVTTVSKQLLSLARSTLSQLSARVIYNGVDSVHFWPATEEVAPSNFLFVGRLIERKGVEHLIDGFAQLVSLNPECRLTLVGTGPARARVEALIERRGIADRVHLMGSVPHGQLPEIYRRSSVFVMPSIHEAMSNAMLEAMASGLPAISTRTGSAELFKDSGILIDSPDAAHICSAAETYLSDPDLRARHGRNARAIAESLTWKRVATEYLDVYHKAIEEPSGPQSRRV